MSAGNETDFADATKIAGLEMLATRLLDAPRDLVFEVFTDPEHLAHWWGPLGFTITTRRADFRPGGQWRFVMQGPDGRDYENLVTYLEIDKPQRLAYKHGGDKDVEPVNFAVEVTLEDVGGKTRLTWRATFPSEKALRHVIQEYGAFEGLKQTLGRLADHLAMQHAFVVARTFDAPRERVWRAHTEVEHLKKWWGPKGFEMLKATLDLRPGGMFHYGMKSPQGQEMWGRFVYREVIPMERIVFVVSFSDPQGGVTRHPWSAQWPLEVLNTLTLAESEGRTTLTIRGAPLNASEEERNAFEAAHKSMEAGFKGTLDQLEEYLRSA